MLSAPRVSPRGRNEPSLAACTPGRDDVWRHRDGHATRRELGLVNLPEVIDRYCMAWSDPDPNRRVELLSAVWSPGATYTDPTVHAAGAEALLAHIERMQITRPGAHVLRSTQIDEHHGIARFGFQVIGTDGTILREGTDIAFISPDRKRIERIVGFFGATAGVQK